MLIRIDTTDPDEHWRLACPAPARHRDWRVVDGHFQCRACDAVYREMIDTKTGERVRREDVEVVGPHAEKVAFGEVFDS